MKTYNPKSPIDKTGHAPVSTGLPLHGETTIIKSKHKSQQPKRKKPTGKMSVQHPKHQIDKQDHGPKATQFEPYGKTIEIVFGIPVTEKESE